MPRPDDDDVLPGDEGAAPQPDALRCCRGCRTHRGSARTRAASHSAAEWTRRSSRSAATVRCRSRSGANIAAFTSQPERRPDHERDADADEIIAAEREGEEIGCECADRDHVRVGEVDLHQNAVDQREAQCDEDVEASEDDTVDCLLQRRRSASTAQFQASAFHDRFRQGLHVVDGVHLDVLIGLVELDAAGHAGKTLCGRHAVADRLRVLAAAAHHVGNHHIWS